MRGGTSGLILGNQDNTNTIYISESNFIRFETNNGTERFRIDSSGHLVFSNASTEIKTNTSDGSDNKRIILCGGGDNSQVRGAQITLYGNEYSSHEGRLQLLAGNSGNDNGVIQMYTGGSQRVIIKNDGIFNIGVTSPQYAKKLNVQGGNDSQISVSNQDYTGYAAGSMSGIEGRLQCGNSIWTTAGIRFKKFNGTIGDKHSYLELYATDGYSNKVGLVVQPDGEVTKARLPCFSVYKYDNANQVSSGVYVFNTVVHNNGSHYNSSNGRFTAPVAGYYFFYFTLQGYGGTSSGRPVSYTHLTLPTTPYV